MSVDLTAAYNEGAMSGFDRGNDSRREIATRIVVNRGEVSHV